MGMGIPIDQLPEHMARRIWKHFAEEDAKKPNPNYIPPPTKRPDGKYGAVKVRRGNITFDSKKEARRYDALIVMLRCGEITDLRIQPEFTLIEAYTTPEGERIRAMRYKADFSYRRDGKLIVEDVKSEATRTRTYLDKRKLMRERYGIDVTEVQSW